MGDAAGSGMGAAAARKLAAEGYRVGILSSSGKGEALAKELGGIGVTGSNQSNADLKRLVDQVVSQWGRIDFLLNNAGKSMPKGILECSEEEFDRLMSVDAQDWKMELLSQEELFSKLYDKLPKEFIFMRELILSALWRSPAKCALAHER